MLPPGTTTSDEANGTVRHRSPAVLLPEDPSPEELAQYWTLSARDKEQLPENLSRKGFVPIIG
jgi:hypothetical protein